LALSLQRCGADCDKRRKQRFTAPRHCHRFAAEQEPSMYFVATCLDKPGHVQTRLDTRPVHLDYLNGLKEKLKVAGALLGPDAQTPVGSMLIFECADEAEARGLVAGDPFAKAGLFASVDIKPWRQGAGAPLA
jgi:uncharacterized protein YciI